MSKVLTKQNVRVELDGVVVVVKIGNHDLKLDYESALILSTWMRVRAKEAKRLAGDTSRHWSVIGRLTALLDGNDPRG